MPKIAVFAGHGGSDPGAVSGNLREKDLNLAVSNAVTAILRSWGYVVMNNRTTDVDRSITRDAQMANDNRVDAVVEIHQNSNPGAPANGSEVFYSIKDTGRGRRLAQAILNQLVALGFRDRGVKTQINAGGQDAFAILRLTQMPAVLVECAFINSPIDMAIFDTNRVAAAIAQGIRDVFPIAGGFPPYPGTALRIGSRGDAVRQIQHCLNNVGMAHPSIPRLNTDGIFGQQTHNAVVAFQRIFGLNPDGVVGPLTWDRLMRECHLHPAYPGSPLRVGSNGEAVRRIQSCLNNVSIRHPSIGTLNADGIFGVRTESSVRAFQRIFGLTADGVVGPVTWARLMMECNNVMRELDADPPRICAKNEVESTETTQSMLPFLFFLFFGRIG
ncbi:MAG: N-acetylmuramoyl-L-alanine amidase [Defluviitaleaceae bacterium]|nr:N-acetylmuramoyl-L-alanine amidase [Defluviitaleaceae bacterium]